MSISLFIQGFGGVVGCLAAAFMMDSVHPKYAFLAYAILELIIGISCIFLNSEAEKEVINLDGVREVETDYSSVLI